MFAATMFVVLLVFAWAVVLAVYLFHLWLVFILVGILTYLLYEFLKDSDLLNKSP